MNINVVTERVSQENSINENFGCPSPPTQLHTAYYCPINHATAAAAATAAAYASSSSMLRRKSMSSLSLPLSLPLLCT